MIFQAISQSTGDISETANEEYFQYVLQRFETELPDYEEALVQNGLKDAKRPRILRFEGLISLIICSVLILIYLCRFGGF